MFSCIAEFHAFSEWQLFHITFDSVLKSAKPLPKDSFPNREAKGSVAKYTQIKQTEQDYKLNIEKNIERSHNKKSSCYLSCSID